MNHRLAAKGQAQRRLISRKTNSKLDASDLTTVERILLTPVKEHGRKCCGGRVICSLRLVCCVGRREKDGSERLGL